jgi:hypothetical protein
MMSAKLTHRDDLKHSKKDEDEDRDVEGMAKAEADATSENESLYKLNINYRKLICVLTFHVTYQLR